MSEEIEYTPLTDGIFSQNSVDYDSLMRRRIKKASNSLQPIFEAFSNAWEAISGIGNSITIELHHIKERNIFGNEFSFGAFSIIDDGDGFTDESFHRLEKLYDESKNKNNLGSGRIQYLHFFKTTQIHSVYMQNDNTFLRRIEMSRDFYKEHNSVIRSLKNEISKNEEHYTRVTFLFPLNDEDKKRYAEISTQEIKDSILKRYLNLFCIKRDNLPAIHINHYVNGAFDKDGSCDITIDDGPTADYEDTVKVHYSILSDKGNSVIPCSKTEDFIIRSYKLPYSILSKNEVRLTSKGESFCYQGFNFPLVSESPRIESGISYLFLISSEYLTSKDTDIRGNLDLVSKSDFIAKRNLFSGREEILIDDIEDQATMSISNHYPAFRQIKEQANDNVRKVAQMFSIDESLLEKAGVKCTDSDVSVLKKVYNFNAEVKAEADAKIKGIFDSLEELDPNDKGFENRFNKKVAELNSALPLSVRNELSQYLSRRTLVIELMQRALTGKLKIQTERPATKRKKKSQPEGVFHNLLFPKGSECTEESNLWMLSEEYIHYRGLSESELDSVKIDGKPLFKQNLTEEEIAFKERSTGDVGIKRPDVLLFPEEGKCIILEFKAPNVDVSKHIHQIKQYASMIHHLSDERFKFNAFYGYLIGENIDPYSVMEADSYFKESQTLGYMVNPHYPLPRFFDREQGSLYMEVIKFSDLLKRATLRSKIFTDKIFPKDIR